MYANSKLFGWGTTVDRYTLDYRDMILTRNLMFDYIRELKGKLAVEKHHWATEMLKKTIADYEKTYQKIIDQIGA